jgi:hypothetical protein
MKKKVILDDSAISKPPYEGPNKEPLPERKLTEEEVEAMFDKLFGRPKDE